MQPTSSGPSPAAADYEAALAALEAKDRPAARAALERVLALEPDHVDAMLRLGAVEHADGRHAEAAEHFRRVTEILPGDFRGWANLGTAQRALQQRDDALDSYHRAVALAPDQARPQFQLGHLLAFDLDDPRAAEPHLRRALELAPDNGQTFVALSEALCRQDRIAEALDLFCAALRLGVAARDLGIKLLEHSGQRPELPAEQIALLHHWRGQDLSQDVPRFAHGPSADAAEKRLRVGYVSADFRYHAVSYFIEPVLREHDRAEVEVWAYSNVAQPDMVTDRLRGLVDQWRDVEPLTTGQLARRIREDEIDILVDLSGYTGGTRLRTFACRPAPVQVTWLGYPDTTGLPAMNYRIVDAITDPEGMKALSSERLLRLAPCFLCYQGADWAPAATPPPVLRHGRVTFGSFNNGKKITDPVIETWARLLRELPSSRLLLKGRAIGDAEGADRLRRAFGAQGVAPERLGLRGWIDEPMPHLRLYGEVDVALDPFPYNGTTTTCEALWMGVPVVALRGDRHVGRVSASLLGAAGLPELVAADPDQYVGIALRLAGDLDALATARAGLRDKLRTSPLCDAQRFASTLEAAYREIWRSWCRSG